MQFKYAFYDDSMNRIGKVGQNIDFWTINDFLPQRSKIGKKLLSEL